MKLIKASYEFENFQPSLILENIEKAGRICYKSEEKITNESSKSFVEKIIGSGHESVIEHEKITAKVVCDRGVSHEIVRHRIASYSQESTRYCNYKGGVTFVIPPWVDIDPGEYFPTDEKLTNLDADMAWYLHMWWCEKTYIKLLKDGLSPQQARSVLPNSTKTEVVMTMNLREWRHFFKLRTVKAAHPQMREVAIPMLEELQKYLPVVFRDIKY